MNEDCTRLAYRLYLQNAQAPPIASAIATIKAYVSAPPHKGITFELASGPLALAAAENETLVHAETSILGWVSLALVAFLVLAWRDWRAATLCLIPLIYCAALGYGFMGAIDMALTMPVLPAMALALAVGIGLILPPCMAMRAHLAEGRNITDSCRLALGETGLALTIGVLAPAGGALIWFMSPDPLMADLGLFFAVMFLCEALAILILMPALAVGLELAFPRRPGFIRHKGP
jgi:predicted RND superfamily exporter protein